MDWAEAAASIITAIGLLITSIGTVIAIVITKRTGHTVNSRFDEFKVMLRAEAMEEAKDQLRIAEEAASALMIEARVEAKKVLSEALNEAKKRRTKP